MALPPFIPSFAVEGYPPPNPANPAKPGTDVEHPRPTSPPKPPEPINFQEGLPPFIPSFAVEGYLSPKPSNPAKAPDNSAIRAATLDGLGGLASGGTNSVNPENGTRRRNTILTRDLVFDGIFPDFDRVVVALLKHESPEETAHNDRLAEADGWRRRPMTPAPFFPDQPAAAPTVSTSCKVLPVVTKPAVAKLVIDPDLNFVRCALTANIFAASRARGLTFRMDADGDLVIQGKGLTERDRLLFEPHETVIVEALNP
jgi:hypothetical protein